MRSRFSAFAVGDVDYLLATWHRSTRPGSLALDPAIHWRRLEILATSAGAADDRDGTVDFLAHFWDETSHQHGLQREKSRFVRDRGHWFYVAPAG